MPTPENVRWEALLPHANLGVAMLIVLILEMVGGKRRAATATALAAAAAGLALTALLLGPTLAEPVFGGTLLHDGLFRLFGSVVVLALLLALLLLDGRGPHPCEQVALLLAAGLGMLLLVGASNLALAFLGLELFSLALYLLCIQPPNRSTAQEAAMKYFLLSSFASAVLLFGFALLYGASGSLDLARLPEAVSAAGRPLLVAGMLMAVLGLGFKLAVVPFHQWAPDVYQGAPTPVTAFMSVATKAAALAFLVRLLPGALAGLAGHWQPVLAACAVLTILGANLAALVQRNLKRMLAWSSVAHAGYLLMAPLAMAGAPSGDGRALEALAFYLGVYAFMNVGAFAVVSWLEGASGTGMDLPALAGLGSRRPSMALGIGVLMLSLAGIPPAGGFFAKFLLFGAALAAHWTFLAVVGVLGSLVGAFYYMRVVLVMYAGHSDQPALPHVPPAVAVVFWTCVVGTLVSGVLAGLPLDLVQGVLQVAVHP